MDRRSIADVAALSTAPDASFSLPCHSHSADQNRVSPTAPGSRFRAVVTNTVCLLAAALLIFVPSLMLVQGAGTPPESVVLQFTATWCGPCQRMSPIVSQLQREGYAIRKVDIDQERGLAQQFNVTTIPCFVLVSNGREVTRIIGSTSEAQLRRLAQQAGTAVAQAASPRTQNVPTPRPLPVTPKRGTTEGMYAVLEGNDVDLGKAAGFESGASPFGSRPAAPPVSSAKPDHGFGLMDRLRGAKNTTAGEGAGAVRGQNEETAPTEGNTPMLASVRLRVKETNGNIQNYGSGTIVHSENGASVIATCGHIFRNARPKATVEVDVFPEGGKPQTLSGTLIDYDLDADIGLVVAASATTLPSIPFADPTMLLSPKQQVFSIGCGGGQPPSVEEHEITSLNRYQGPDNIECTGTPVLGRSGGGLFLDGHLIGVCSGADTKEMRGIFAAATCFAAMLQKNHLEMLLPTPATPAIKEFQPRNDSSRKLQEELAGAGDKPFPFDPAAGFQGLSADETRQVFSESPDAEVICIVRPRGKSQGSKVVILNRASQTFTSYLLREVESQDARLPTSMRVEAGSESPVVVTPLIEPNVAPKARSQPATGATNTRDLPSDADLTSWDAK